MKINFSSHGTPAAMIKLIAGIAACLLQPVLLHATTPAWWNTRGVINATGTASDYSAVNQGQVKNIVVAAVFELNAYLPGGAGSFLNQLVVNLSGTTPGTSDFSAVNLGQLKTLTSPFYDQLLAAGYLLHPLESGTYPWINSSTNIVALANDYAIANIGQVKNLFSFDLVFSSDGSGLPDWWEMKYFGHLGVDPNADPDGDSLTNLQEYQTKTNPLSAVLDTNSLPLDWEAFYQIPHGTDSSTTAPRGDGLTYLQACQLRVDPMDYYNGILPTLTVISGGNQMGSPGSILPIPISASASGYVNAPINFTVKSGHALLSTTNDGGQAKSSSLSVRTTGTYTDFNANQQRVAQVYVYLPSVAGDLSVIEVTAISAGKSTSITTTAISTDPALPTPTEFTVSSTSPTSASLSWTPADASQPTTIEASIDGANWLIVGTVAPGIHTATVTGLASGECALFRIFTGGTFTPVGGSTFSMPSPENAPSPSGGSGSPPTQGVTVTPSSEPVLEGEISSRVVVKPGFLGFRSQNDITYLKAVANTVAYFGEDSFTCTQTVDPATGVKTMTGPWNEYDYDHIMLNAAMYDDHRTETTGEGAIFLDNESHGGDYHCYFTLSELYDPATFKADTVKKIPPFTGNFQKGVNCASFYYYICEDGPWTETEYKIEKLQYRWQVAKDPGLVMHWLVVFEPDEDDAFEIEAKEWASMGQTESPPFVIDPTNYPSLNPDNKNGDYYIVSPQLTVDANRDGTIDPETDQTSEQKPFQFWCNDDDDSNEMDHPGSTTKDSDSNTIISLRDLEDFARLHIYIDELQDAIASGTITIGLEWRNVTSGSPSIKVFAAVENDGGAAYLTDTSGVAPGNQMGATSLGTITSGGSYKFPASLWQADALSGRPVFSSIQPNRYLLFEGCSEGKGQLVLTFWKGADRIGEGGSVWLDLKNIKKMYVRAKGTPVDGIAAPWSDENPLPTDFADDSNGNAFSQPSDEEKNVIVFIHGIHPPGSTQNTGYEGNINTAETIFKRLWHGGYKGRFACYTWPALTPAGLPPPFGFDFNESEYRGWKYGRGLERFVASMPSDYRKHVFAHSQGNAVVGSAFRSYGLTAATWIPTNGAIPISCYDSNIANYIFQYITPDLSANLGYRGYLEGHVNARVVNFSNNTDTVTGAIWEQNQRSWKPDVNWTSLITRYEYSYYSGSGEVVLNYWLGGNMLSSRPVSDLHESMATVVQSRSMAIGQGWNVGGVVNKNVDINSEYSFGDSHGAQWEWNIQNTLPYYKEIIDILHYDE